MSRVSGQQFTGVCKFWNAVKGFGFLTADDGGSDLFVSQHDLVTGDSGFRALTAGQRVECTYTVGDDRKAIGKNITAVGGAPLASFKDMYTAKREIEAAKPPDPNKKYGTIKWFNVAKSFGFIIPKQGGEDLFFHFSECLKGIVPKEGDQVEYGTKEDKNGKTIGSQVKNKTQKGPPKNPHLAPVAVPQGYPPQMMAQQPQALPGYAAYAMSMGGKKTGVVKFFDEEKGYGFIIPDNGGRDIHVHKSNVMGGELQKDDAVEYDEEPSTSGKIQAVGVSRAPTGKRGAEAAGAYATKRPRVMYDPNGAQPTFNGEAYQYFDPSAAGSSAPRYY